MELPAGDVVFHGLIAVAPLKRQVLGERLDWMLKSSTASSPWPH